MMKKKSMDYMQNFQEKDLEKVIIIMKLKK